MVYAWLNGIMVMDKACPYFVKGRRDRPFLSPISLESGQRHTVPDLRVKIEPPNVEYDEGPEWLNEPYTPSLRATIYFSEGG